jgi:hypothetical protein
MSMKKSLLTLAVTALAMMGFASSAMAEAGHIRDVQTGLPPAEGREFHFVGWTKFETAIASLECHVTAVLVATGTEGRTGHIKTYTVPDTNKCKATGALAGCKLTKHEATTTGPNGEETWDVTATKEDFDLTSSTGVIVIHDKFEGFLCPTEVTLTTEESITLRPLKTTNKHAATNTLGNLGETAKSGEPIAGVEFHIPKSVKHTADITNSVGGHSKEEITTNGELELTEPDRCTWELIAG